MCSVHALELQNIHRDCLTAATEVQATAATAAQYTAVLRQAVFGCVFHLNKLGYFAKVPPIDDRPAPVAAQLARLAATSVSTNTS